MKNKFEKIFTSDYFMYCIIGIISFFVFITIYGIKVLDPTYTDWLMAEGADLTQHYLGWVAYRRSGWHFPIGMTDTLAYPNLTSIIFTDSIPLFAVPFKLLSPVLPAQFQYFGFWGLMCFVLQGVLGARIVRRFTDNKFAVVLAGTILLYTPIMIRRMYGHTALAGQWILLLGMYPLFDNDRYKNDYRIVLYYAILGLLAANIHMYYVLMCGILVAGAAFSDIIKNHKFLRPVLTLVAYIAVAGLVVGLLGGFNSGMETARDGLGEFSFNGNALFNSQGYSKILKELPLAFYLQYEGFAYVGFGVIVLAVMAPVFFFLKGKVKDTIRNNYKTIIVLVVVFLVALIIALSPTVTFGSKVLFTVKLPDFVTKKWAIFRASGRIGWICVYLFEIVSMAIVAAFFEGKQKLLKYISSVLFGIALLIQVYDLSDVIEEKNDYFANETEAVSLLENDAFWQTVSDIPEISHIVYYSLVSNEYMFSLTDYAFKNDMDVSNFYFARVIDVSGSTNEALSKLPDSDLFIFGPDSGLIYKRFDLHYYDVDGLVVGYKKPIAGFAEINQKELFLWQFGNNEYIFQDTGVDTENGRVLYPEGISYGPYWNLPATGYTLTILGSGLSSDMDLKLYSERGAKEYSYYLEEKNDNKIVLSFFLTEDVSNFEIFVQNKGDNPITMKSFDLNESMR